MSNARLTSSKAPPYCSPFSSIALVVSGTSDAKVTYRIFKRSKLWLNASEHRVSQQRGSSYIYRGYFIDYNPWGFGLKGEINSTKHCEGRRDINQAEDEEKCLTNCVPPTAYMAVLQKVTFPFGRWSREGDSLSEVHHIWSCKCIPTVRSKLAYARRASRS